MYIFVYGDALCFCDLLSSVKSVLYILHFAMKVASLRDTFRNIHKMNANRK
jgi:hypothetical protein